MPRTRSALNLSVPKIQLVLRAGVHKHPVVRVGSVYQEEDEIVLEDIIADPGVQPSCRLPRPL